MCFPRLEGWTITTYSKYCTLLMADTNKPIPESLWKMTSAPSATDHLFHPPSITLSSRAEKKHCYLKHCGRSWKQKRTMSTHFTLAERRI